MVKRIETIPVGSATIVIYQHSVAKFIASKHPEKWSHLRNIITMLMGSKEFRDNAEENLKELNKFIPQADFNRVQKIYNKYRTIYTKTDIFSSIISNFKHDNTLRATDITDYFESEQQKMMDKVPVVNDVLLLLFFALIKGTILENQLIPKEIVNSNKDVQQSINLESNRYGGFSH